MTLPRSRFAGAVAVALAVIVAGLELWLGPASPSRAVAAEPAEFSRYVDESGNIARPEDYKTTFLHLGTFAVSTTPGGPPDELHGVYARPEDVRAFRRDGKFPDGAVLVKDVLATRSEPLTTGDAAYAAGPKSWFVMIKDAQGRFKDNDLWGDGWGWALFEADDPATNVATDYRTDCRSCHVPARKDDWLYVRGYPVLHERSEPR